MTRWRAEAPGKAVLLGEYAVLDGAPALVAAVDRYCRVELEPVSGKTCMLTTRMDVAVDRAFAATAPSGVPLVDLVRSEYPRADHVAWRATLDSRDFWSFGMKLGLGSSAAALSAWAGAWTAQAERDPPALAALVELHRRFQGGRGSGIDIAASVHGGVIEFRLGSTGVPHIGSVRLPNGVGFAGIFAGRSASTPQLVGRYRAFCAERPGEAADHLRRLSTVAAAGCGAARGDDAAAFIAAIADYGRALYDLGVAIGGEIVTAEHRRIEAEARRFGVAYKVSGAGGGDLGVAFSADRGALDSFKQSMSNENFRVVELCVAERGITVEERSE